MWLKFKKFMCLAPGSAFAALEAKIRDFILEFFKPIIKFFSLIRLRLPIEVKSTIVIFCPTCIIKLTIVNYINFSEFRQMVYRNMVFKLINKKIHKFPVLSKL
jgi:hypothetical protein